MVYIDRKYLLLISARLPCFTIKKEDLYNFRCPVCGDSKKNPTKARGFIYRKGNDYFYSCHNCGMGTTFSKFLKHLDPELHREYVVECFASNKPACANTANVDITQMLSGPKPQNRIKRLEDLTGSIDTLPDGHYAKEYVRARKVPMRFWNEIFYVEKYKSWLDETFPDHGKENLIEDARLVLCFTDRTGIITNVSGRALAAENKLRYITVKVSDEKKIFGLHRMNPKRTVYVTEGQFDSFFLPNALASGDSNLTAVADYLKREFDDPEVILVYDAEPRNKELVKQIKKAIDGGYTVSLLPYNPTWKDLNDMVRDGLAIENVESVVYSSAARGLTAQIRFTEWRKC